MGLPSTAVIAGSALFRHSNDGDVASMIDHDFARALASTVGANRVIGAVDSRGGRVCIHGWKTVLPLCLLFPWLVWRHARTSHRFLLEQSELKHRSEALALAHREARDAAAAASREKSLFLATASLILLAASLASASVLAQTFPSKPIRVYSPAPGGPTDMAIRLIQNPLAESMGHGNWLFRRPIFARYGVAIAAVAIFMLVTASICAALRWISALCSAIFSRTQACFFSSALTAASDLATASAILARR